MCQVLARLAVVEPQAWRASLAPAALDGVATQRPELALFALAISVAIGLDGTWLPVAEARVHFVAAAPEQDLGRCRRRQRGRRRRGGRDGESTECSNDQRATGDAGATP
jgi:hypothetical protein